ncbi:MAG: polynucleotide adenylyltransferase PcnB [Gammaproteobacteria bacterium]
MNKAYGPDSELKKRDTDIFSFFKKIIKTVETPLVRAEPTIYQRSEHCISRSQISENALKVLYRLKNAGFEAYLVGGCVRDLLLGREPKDFDVVTDAHPEQVRKIFRNCRLIGRRFRLAHVHYGPEIIEVATFRGAADSSDSGKLHSDDNGRVLRDNVYGTIDEDVWRRDFTVNALYYNIKDFSIVDYAGGMLDHSHGILKLIGDPRIRYREDPVRMLRAVRFAVKLGFKLHPDCEKPISDMRVLLENIPAARLYDEWIKLFFGGYAVQTFEMLRHYGLFAVLFPDTESSLALEEQGFPKVFLTKALENTDKRLAEGKTVTPYFLLSAFLWEPMSSRLAEKTVVGKDIYSAYQEAANEVIGRQIKYTAFPKQIGLAMREVWSLQPRFERRQGTKTLRLLEHPRFRAAYDFLLLRAETGGADYELAEWWTHFQEAEEVERVRMIKTLTGPRKRRPKRRRAAKKTTEQQ